MAKPAIFHIYSSNSAKKIEYRLYSLYHKYSRTLKSFNHFSYKDWIYENITGTKEVIMNQTILISIEFESEKYLTLFLLEYGS